MSIEPPTGLGDKFISRDYNTQHQPCNESLNSYSSRGSSPDAARQLRDRLKNHSATSSIASSPGSTKSLEPLSGGSAVNLSYHSNAGPSVFKQYASPRSKFNLIAVCINIENRYIHARRN